MRMLERERAVTLVHKCLSKTSGKPTSFSSFLLQSISSPRSHGRLQHTEMAASVHCGKADMRERMCVRCSSPGKCSQPWFHTRATRVNCLNVDIERERYDATSEREDRAQHFGVDGIVIMEAVSVGFEDILGSPLVPHPSSSTWILLSGCWTALLTWPCGVGSCLKIPLMGAPIH